MRAACTLFILKNYYKYKTGFLAVVIKPTALAYTGSKTLAGCGLSNLEPYVVVKAFTVTYNSVEEKLILLRDPSGTPGYTGDWSKTDTTRWTADTIQHVPYLVDPTNADYY